MDVWCFRENYYREGESDEVDLGCISVKKLARISNVILRDGNGTVTKPRKGHAMGRRRREMVSGQSEEIRWSCRLEWQQQIIKECLKSQRLVAAS